MDQWRICIQDKYPAYISWQTYEQIQAMLQDNYAVYTGNTSRGIPRPGSALLQGIVYCGECGHKLVVQYQPEARYLCDYLRKRYGVAVCQKIPGDPIDTAVVDAFFQAFSAIELDGYEQAMAAVRDEHAQVNLAQRQQVERLGYQAALAERQYNQVDPDNRLVAVELERRWEVSLQALRQAEETYRQTEHEWQQPLDLPPELKEAFLTIGQKLPEIWPQELLSQQQKKALLRCLIEKVILHRRQRDTVQTRIVWRGGDTTTLQVPIPVGSFADLSSAQEMETIILDRARQGESDEEIAEHLTTLGHRSPMDDQRVLPNTVRTVRLKHGLLRQGRLSRPRRIPGYLTLPQVARALALNPHWLYDQINRNRIHITKDEETGLYLFPDTPDVLAQLQGLYEGETDIVDITQIAMAEDERDDRGSGTAGDG
jgi:hypothetical protein